MIAEYLFKKLINANKVVSSVINKISKIPQDIIKRFTYYLLDDLYFGKEPKERKKSDPAFLFYKALPLFEKRWIKIQKKCNESEQYSIYAICSILNNFIEKPFSNLQDDIRKLWNQFLDKEKDKKIQLVKQNFRNQLLNSLNLNELTDICRSYKISGYSNLRKAEIIDLIRNSLNDEKIINILKHKGYSSEEIIPLVNQFPLNTSSFFSELLLLLDKITLDNIVENLPKIFKDQREMAINCINLFQNSKNEAIFLSSEEKEQAKIKTKPIIDIIKDIEINQIKDDQISHLTDLNVYLNDFKESLINLLYPSYLFLKKQYENNRVLIFEDYILKDIEQILKDFNKIFDLVFNEKGLMITKVKKLTLIKDLLIKILRTTPLLFRNLIISRYMNKRTLSGIEKGFKAIDTLNSIFGCMGWDLSSGILKNLSLQKILEYSSILEKIPELQKIAENLGRFEGAFSTKEKWRLSPFVSEEIFDIHLSDDIHRVLAVELGKLNQPLLKSLFMANWLDHKLLTYQLRGNEKYSMKEKKEEKRGPIIICIDTSGSMVGFPEQLAKSLSLAVIKIAQSEKRNVHIILFSGPKNIKEFSMEQMIFKENKTSPINDYEGFWKKQEVRNELKKRYYSNIIDILSFSFGGGTDFREPLKQAQEKLKDKKYEKADILFVSDGISFIDDIVREVSEEIKEKKARIFTVVIGRDTNIVREFSDYLYVLSPSLAHRKSSLDNNIGDLLKKITIST